MAADSALVLAVRTGLAELANPAKAPDMRAYMKSDMPFRGVQKPARQELAGRVFAEHPLSDVDAWTATVLELWRGAEYREERYLALDLTAYRAYAHWQSPDVLPLYEELIVTGAWWDFVDEIANRRIGPLVRAHPDILVPIMRTWSRDPDRWKRRTSIICQLGSKHDTDLDLLAETIEANIADPDFFLRKGIGWALRQQAKTDPAGSAPLSTPTPASPRCPTARPPNTFECLGTMTIVTDEPSEPMTRARIGEDLRRLGLRGGDIVLVHASLRSLGWVCGGALATVQALLDVLGPTGTLVVPTHSGENSDPKHWQSPPVPESWWPVIREHMPAFDPTVTPSYAVGVIPEVVRTWPGAVRSDHPHTSFAAVGPAAASLMAGHKLESQCGESSPLAALERADARVLLLGVGFDTCTTFHLAEYRVPGLPTFEFGAAVHTATGRQWVTFTDVQIDSDDFAALGKAFEATDAVRTGQVGAAQCRLFDVRPAVEFAVGWLRDHRESVLPHVWTDEQRKERAPASD